MVGVKLGLSVVHTFLLLNEGELCDLPVLILIKLFVKFFTYSKPKQKY